MSGCVDLIGQRFRLGGDGSDGSIDCIHLVYAVLAELGIPTPTFDRSWYTASWWQVARDLLKWGRRIERASYDGDVILLQQDRKAFAVIWSQGALHINQRLQRVDWCRLEQLPRHYAFRSFHLNAS